MCDVTCKSERQTGTNLSVFICAYLSPCEEPLPPACPFADGMVHNRSLSRVTVTFALDTCTGDQSIQLAIRLPKEGCSLDIISTFRLQQVMSLENFKVDQNYQVLDVIGECAVIFSVRLI